mgnify:FL=1
MKSSQIQWTDHTFNPWWGCEKVSPGCKHCYAEKFADKRLHLKVWGAQAERRIASEKTWADPLKWNAEAAKEGKRARVFCASMADVFESYEGPSAERVKEARERLWALIEVTPWLDWLLLTKRPQNIHGMLSHRWGIASFPKNLWLGCTVENQEEANRRLPLLLDINCAVRFVSYEPALEPIDFTKIKLDEWCAHCESHVTLNALTHGSVSCECGSEATTLTQLSWVIVGGESGNGARPFNPAWALSTVEQCQGQGVPVFVKQMGSNPTLRSGSGWGPVRATKGDNQDEWPKQLRVREFPDAERKYCESSTPIGAEADALRDLLEYVRQGWVGAHVETVKMLQEKVGK